MRIIQLGWLIGLTLISGCSVIDAYLTPQIKTPEQWQAPLPHQGKIEQLAKWWEQFDDPVLNDLLAQAQAESPSLDIALANIKASRANVQSARAQGLPTLSSSASITKNKGAGNSIGVSGGTIEVDSIGLDASWELDLFGKIAAGKQSAQAQLEAKEIAWHEARVSLAAEVATEYINYRACEASVSALESALNSRTETAKLTTISANAGFSAPADASLAEAAARASASTLIGQQAECDNYVKSLVALTNLSEQDLRTRLKAHQGIPVPHAFEVDFLPADLLTRRPDLAIDERNLAAASADIGVAKAQLLPSLSLSGSIAYQRVSVNGGPSNRSNTWSYGPTLDLPIFDGGDRRAQLSIARANFDSALATYKQDVRTAIKEVEQALVNLDSAALREKAEQESAEAYRHYFEAAEINWKSGGLDLLGLEDARRQKINAELNVITQQKNRVLYWIALYKAFGGDWLESTSHDKQPFIEKKDESRAE